MLYVTFWCYFSLFDWIPKTEVLFSDFNFHGMIFIRLCLTFRKLNEMQLKSCFQVGKGYLRVKLADSKKENDMIPVDVVSNCLIAAAWKVGTSKPDSIPVYNCSSCGDHRMRWNEFSKLFFPLPISISNMDRFRDVCVIYSLSNVDIFS